MGVKQLWKLLKNADLVENWDASTVPALAQELEGKVLAVDLSMWLMQASEQVALTPHFNVAEGAAKVAFERTLHMLRFGLTPVFVIEGLPPAEKAAAQRRRMGDRLGFAPPADAYTSSRRSTTFTRFSTQVAGVLEAMGLPIVRAPGEAEACCAALCQAGAVDGVSSFDSDTLLFGAETVYPLLKLSAVNNANCEVTKCAMSAVRNHLGLTTPGSGKQALMLFGALCGCDYDESGAQGIGPTGALTLVQNLLVGESDDSSIFDKFEALLATPTDPTLAELTKCTGCKRCGHDGGRKGRINGHTAANPCPCCPGVSGAHACIERPGAVCQCTFHRREEERKVARFVNRARADPDLLRKFKDAMSVFEREAVDAATFVTRELRLRGIAPGQRFRWLHRPRVVQVCSAFRSLPGELNLNWDETILRSKLLPGLIEWDLRQGAPALSSSARGAGNRSGVEFLPKAVSKVHGSGGADQQWRYLMEFERTEADLEHMGETLRPVGAKNNNGLGPEGAGSQYHSQYQDNNSDNGDVGPSSSSQGGGDGGAYNGPLVSVVDYDKQWLAATASRPHRAVRQSLLREKWPEVEAAWVEKVENRARGNGPGIGRGRGRGRGRGTARTAGLGNEGLPDGPEVQQQLAPLAEAVGGRSGTGVDKSPVQTPRRSQKEREKERCMPPGSIDRFLRPMRPSAVNGDHGKFTDAELISGMRQRGLFDDPEGALNGDGMPAVPGEKTKAAARVLAEQRAQLRQLARQADPNIDEASPSKRQRTPTQTPLAPATATQAVAPAATVAPRTAKTLPRTNSSLQSPTVPDSEGIKTLRRIIELRKSAQQQRETAAALEASQPENLSRVRARGREVGRMLSIGGVEVIDLVSSPEGTPARDFAEEERRPRQGATTPPARRRLRSPVLIDLTLGDDYSDDEI